LRSFAENNRFGFRKRKQRSQREEEFMEYQLEGIVESGKFYGIRISKNGRMCVELRDGISMTISSVYENMPEISQRRFLEGIVLAMAHCSITGQVPVAMVG
jgi:hypothetical protein